MKWSSLQKVIKFTIKNITSTNDYIQQAGGCLSKFCPKAVAVVKYLHHHPYVNGSSSAAPASTWRGNGGKMCAKVKHSSFLWPQGLMLKTFFVINETLKRLSLASLSRLV